MLYLNRRSDVRVNFRKLVRFNPDNSRPVTRLERGISQDLSVRGMRLLCPVALEKGSTFDLWLPIEGYEVLKARATARWVEVEDTLGDSPYWVRCGLSLTFVSPMDRRHL